MSLPTIGPDVGCEQSVPLAVALDAIAGFAPEAERLERSGVTEADVRRLASVGVMTVGGGNEFSPAQEREIQEQLAAASGALWFVSAQHRSPAVAAQNTSNRALRQRYADGLASGALLGAVSFAHLRRAKPTVVAERLGAGWTISGRLDWITSWGVADVLLLMAETADSHVVQCLLPAQARPGLDITGELSLAAMGGTSTVGAVLEGMTVADSEVADVLPKSQWALSDAHRTANVPAAVVGIARAAVNALTELASERSWAELKALATEWSSHLIADRRRAYELVDDVAPEEALDERLALRGSVTKLAQDATAMLVAAQAGRAVLTSSAAQRWSREAMFALVQAQTPVSRNALIAAYHAGLSEAEGRAAR